MSAFSSLGIRLCLLFGSLLVLAIVAEACYLLWWKKKTQENQEDIENQNFSPFKKSPLQFSCFKTTTTSSRNISNQPSNNLQNCLKESDDIKEKEQEEPTSKDLQVKCLDEESVDVEIMRLHNLCGPPRFLTTINEETKEDMEVDSIKGSRTSDVSSPLKNTQYLNMEGFLNPLYDFEAHEFDISKFRSSPPPTFKFMRDAEEKFLRRLIAFEAQKRANSAIKQEVKEGSFLKFGGNKWKSEDVNLHHNHNHNQISTPSQVLPLAYSPLE